MAGWLYSMADRVGSDAEVSVELDGTLYEFTLEETEERFDDFYTVYPAGVKIVPRQ